MRTVLAIPARLTPKVADALLTLYSVKAESVHDAVNREAADDQSEPVRSHRAELLELDELLQQLDFDTDRRRAVTILGERHLLAAAVSDAAHLAADQISVTWDDYRHGRAPVDQLYRACKDFRGLLSLLLRVETAPNNRPPRIDRR